MTLIGSESLGPCWHILVAGAESRNRTKGFKRHVWNGPLPDGSFYRIGEDLYITSPEFSLVLIAQRLSLIDLTLLCCESCGRYVRDPAHPKGFYKRPAITNIMRIEAFIEKLGPARGTAKLRNALRYALENAWSPMESAVALLMSMPVRLGGYGFPKPLLNYRKHFSLEEARMANREHVDLDVYFKDFNVAVEYNSDEDHTGAARIASDAIRNNTIEYIGIRVMILTWGQVRYLGSFDDAMKQLANKLGRTVHAPSKAVMAKRRQLRKCALPPVLAR